MTRKQRQRLYGLTVTLIVSGLAAAALWTEPIATSFTIGGHLGATAALAAVTAFFVALFVID